MRNLMLPPLMMVYLIIAMIGLHYFLPVTQVWGAHLCWVGVALMAAGLVIAQWHAHVFKRLGTNINTFEEPDQLVRSGLFRYSRNPMYLGLALIPIGLALCLGSVSAILAVLGFLLLLNYWYVPLEERAMLRRFGQQYVDYQKTVRRWI